MMFMEKLFLMKCRRRRHSAKGNTSYFSFVSTENNNIFGWYNNTTDQRWFYRGDAHFLSEAMAKLHIVSIHKNPHQIYEDNIPSAQSRNRDFVFTW